MEKETINIIIVEDAKNTQDMYESTIEEFNLDNEIHLINAFHLVDDKQVPKILFEERIDAIIIDLDWGSGNQNLEGNRLVKKIYEDSRVPIFIVSGNISKLDEEYKESPIFKKYSREDVEFDNLLTEIELLYTTGYTKALGNQSMINNLLSKVFWEYMSYVIHSWQNESSEIKNQRMLRFAVTRINEMLTINTNDKEDSYDALEFYINPTIKEKPFTGDIVIYEDVQYIVITAACDVENDKNDFVLLSQIDFAKFENLKIQIKEKQSGNNKGKLKNYINNKNQRFHLLPPYDYFEGGFIDFQMLRSISKEDFEKKTTVVLSVNPVFVKDIQSRFSHYYGRQGQPQLNFENILDWIINSKSK